MFSRIISLFFLASLLICSPAFLSCKASAAPRDPLALGLIVGSPTGVTMRYKLSSANAFDASLGWYLWNGIHLNGAYIWTFSNAFNLKEPNLEWYVGMGSSVWTWGYGYCDELGCIQNRESVVALSAYFPVGVSYLLTPVPIEFFGQLAGDLVFFPGPGFGISLALGGRYYF